jgi:hypothetical protein
MQRHLKLAPHDGGFLVVYAPHEAESARPVRIAEPFGLKLANKYNRLTLQDLT